MAVPQRSSTFPTWRSSEVALSSKTLQTRRGNASPATCCSELHSSLSPTPLACPLGRRSSRRNPLGLQGWRRRLHLHATSARENPPLSQKVFTRASAAATEAPPDPDAGTWKAVGESARAAVAEAEELLRSTTSQVQQSLTLSGEVLTVLCSESFCSFQQLVTSADVHSLAGEAAGMLAYNVEKLSFDASREAARFAATHGASEKASEAALLLRLAASEVDCHLQLRQRWRQLQWELGYYSMLSWKLLRKLQKSPTYPFFAVALLVWMLRAGIIQHAVYWMLWTIPLLPLAAWSLLKASLIQGHCPSCGHRFMGPRRVKLSCRQCKEVVWQPRTQKTSGEETKRPGQGGQRRPLIVVDLNPDGSFT